MRMSFCWAGRLAVDVQRTVHILDAAALLQPLHHFAGLKVEAGLLEDVAGLMGHLGARYSIIDGVLVGVRNVCADVHQQGEGFQLAFIVGFRILVFKDAQAKFPGFGRVSSSPADDSWWRSWRRS